MINLHDVETAAAARLTRPAYDYYRGGARDERALRRNCRAYEEYVLHYRVLAGIEKVDLSTRVLGHPVALPLAAAPTAFHCMAHPEGEVASARALGSLDALFILSTLSNKPMEEVVAASPAPVFFQLYVYKDRGVTRELVQRAEAAGARALVITVDLPVHGGRERDLRNRFTLPQGLTLANVQGESRSSLGDGGLVDYVGAQLDPTFSWKDLAWLQQQTRLPVVVKGVVRPDDARRAADQGVAAVVVSNHGGRQLDQSPATLHCVTPIREALPESVEVWMDGGIRRGGDVLTALCLGAQLVLVGRPLLWGLAAAGEQGVIDVFQQLRHELEEAMHLVGCANLAEIDRSLVERVGPLCDCPV